LETGVLTKTILCNRCLRENPADSLLAKYAPYPKGTTPEQVDQHFKEHNPDATAHDLECEKMTCNNSMKEDTLERETERIRKQTQDALRVICGKVKGDTKITLRDAEAYLLRCRAYLNRLQCCYCANSECPYSDLYVLKEAQNPLDQFNIVNRSDEFVKYPEKPVTKDLDTKCQENLTECFNQGNSEIQLTETDESGDESGKESGEESEEEQDSEKGYMNEANHTDKLCVQCYDKHGTNPSVSLLTLLRLENHGRFLGCGLFAKFNRQAADQDPNYPHHLIESKGWGALNTDLLVCSEACGRAMKKQFQDECSLHDPHFSKLRDAYTLQQVEDIKKKQMTIKKLKKATKKQWDDYDEEMDEEMKPLAKILAEKYEQRVKKLETAFAKLYPTYDELTTNYANSTPCVKHNVLDIAFDSGMETDMLAIEQKSIRLNETESSPANKKQCIEAIDADL